MNVRISKGIVHKKQKIVIYGPEGIGKSTLASKFPNPLFIDTEGSTNKLDVNRFEDKPSSWTMLSNYITYVKEHPGICGTLVIDTMDWAERLCVEDVLNTYNKKGIEDFGYGNGYVYVAEAVGRLLNLLQELVDKDICNVVITCHAQLKKFEQPDERGAYDRYELKLGKKTNSQTSPLVKEWADMILFCNYETFAVATDKDGKKFKAKGGQRVMYTEHHPCWDAKNRDGLPPKLPMDFSSIAHVISGSPAPVSNPAPSPAPQITPKQTAAPAPAPASVQAPPTVQPAVNQAVHTTPQTAASSAPDPVPAPAAAPAPHTSPPDTLYNDDLSDFEEFREIVIPDGTPPKLKDLMKLHGISEEEVRWAVAKAGVTTEAMRIETYPPDLVDYLIPYWDKIVANIMEQRKLPF